MVTSPRHPENTRRAENISDLLAAGRAKTKNLLIRKHVVPEGKPSGSCRSSSALCCQSHRAQVHLHQSHLLPLPRTGQRWNRGAGTHTCTTKCHFPRRCSCLNPALLCFLPRYVFRILSDVNTVLCCCLRGGFGAWLKPPCLS